jgi:hypothetical protein
MNSMELPILQDTPNTDTWLAVRQAENKNF